MAGSGSQGESLLSATPNTGETYICDSCGEECVTEWTSEEAEAEMLKKWGPLAVEDRAIVCDDCFQEFEAWNEARRKQETA